MAVLLAVKRSTFDSDIIIISPRSEVLLLVCHNIGLLRVNKQHSCCTENCDLYWWWWWWWWVVVVVGGGVGVVGVVVVVAFLT